MALSSNLSTYTDVHRVLEAALANDGVLYTLETPGKARHFIMRCNNYRKLLHEHIRLRQKHTNITRTKFDGLTVTRDPSDLTMVRIEPVAIGNLRDRDGNPVQAPNSKPDDVFEQDESLLQEVTSELEESALEFAKSLKLKTIDKE